MPTRGAGHTLTTYAITNAFPNTYRATVHNSCICNELASLHNRHLIDRSHIPYSHGTFKRALAHSLPVLRQIQPVWTSHWEIAKGYRGGKRAIYERACKWIDFEGYRPRDSKLKMFIKPDKYPVATCPSKPPRAIQFRTPKYNLLLAGFLRDLEHKFYQQAGKPGLPDIAKGKNPQQRASILLAKAAEFKNPVFFNSDYSKMDSCVRVEMQQLIFNRVYKKFFPQRLLATLLKQQINNTGRTKHGIKYGMKGSRCSGDFNTGFENTLINWLVIRFIAHEAGVHQEMFVDGDDAVIIVEVGDASKFERAFRTRIGSLGFEVKLVRSATLVGTPFCQSKVVPAEVPFMARDPLRALSNHNISLKHYPPNVWPRLEEAKMLCELYSNPGSPVLSVIASAMLTGIKPLFDNDTFSKLSATAGVTLQPVTERARIYYHQAWGISPYEQILFETNPDLVSLCNIAVGRNNGTATYEKISAKFATLGDDVDYGRFSNW